MEIRKYKTEDKIQIISLIEVVWGGKFAKTFNEIFEWKVEKSSKNWSNDTHTLVIEKDESIIGLFTVTPVPIKIKNRIVTGLWLGDYVVHPKHRGSAGMRLATQVMREPHVLLGTPNEISYKISKKFKFFDILTITNWVYIINMKKILGKKVKNKYFLHFSDQIWKIIRKICFPGSKVPVLKDTILVKAKKFDHRINTFFQEIRDEHEIMIARNKKFLNWRFTERPDREYGIYLAVKKEKILGYVVFSNETIEGIRYGHIVDLLVKNSEIATLNMLIIKAKIELERSGVDIITFYISSKSMIYNRVLIKNGFIFKKIMRKLIGYSNNDSVTSKELMQGENWFISMADSDLEMV
jgi:hypothetical protein